MPMRRALIAQRSAAGCGPPPPQPSAAAVAERMPRLGQQPCIALASHGRRLFIVSWLLSSLHAAALRDQLPGTGPPRSSASAVAERLAAALAASDRSSCSNGSNAGSCPCACDVLRQRSGKSSPIAFTCVPSPAQLTCLGVGDTTAAQSLAKAAARSQSTRMPYLHQYLQRCDSRLRQQAKHSEHRTRACAAS